MAAFIEAWNEVAWDDIPSRTRETILGDALGLAEEMRAVNQGCLSPLDFALSTYENCFGPLFGLGRVIPAATPNANSSGEPNEPIFG